MQSDVKCLRIFPSTFGVILMVISSKYFFLMKTISRLEHAFVRGALYHCITNAGILLRGKRGGQYKESQMHSKLGTSFLTFRAVQENSYKLQGCRQVFPSC